MTRRLLDLLAAASLLLCLAASAHRAFDPGRTYVLLSAMGSHADSLHLKAILWLERQQDPDVTVVQLDHWTTTAGFLHGTRGQAYRVLAVPHWPAVALTALAPAAWAARHLRHRRAARTRHRGRCPRCGYDVRATPDKCPECGTPAAAPINGARRVPAGA